MSMQVMAVTESAGERTWREGEAATIAAITSMNLATVALVDTVGRLIDNDGWMGAGLASVEQWVAWKANVSRRRAAGFTQIARRRHELPVCWQHFAEGRLTEDAMVRIAQRVPAERDHEVAQLAGAATIAQLTRMLSCLPERVHPDAPTPPERERYLHTYARPDGWGEGSFSLPPDEFALVMVGLTAARDAEFKDRNDLPIDADVPAGETRAVSWADALVRMGSEAADALDATFQRTGYRGERHQVVLHHHVDAAGHMSPGRLHLGGFVADPVARYLACDAHVVVAAYENGRLLGIHPAERTPSRRLRRALEHRDGGCAHPLCEQKRWLHAHYIRHWEDGGATVPSNLLCLCPAHHRALHQGDFTITGDPEAATVRFVDRHGTVIEPPGQGARQLPPPPLELTYLPPSGERFHARDFAWS